MVNHARTVLLNEPARVLAGLSTIYVPQDFKPVEIPDVFAALYGFIFPDTFSLAAKIVRVDQIMQLLSSGELVPFVLSMDSRVTYGSEPAATLTASVAPALVEDLAKVGARFTHHTSIAPTGTISLSLANNASNGIEPSFAHHYFRNVIREGRKTKERVDVYSYELLAYRVLVNNRAMPGSTKADEMLPEYFVTADSITPAQHVDIQAASQKWIDSSISKTANVPTDFKYDAFKDIYLYAYEQGLKGCTTFRFNPEAFQGVLVKEEDLKNTTYVFTLDDGKEVKVRGDEEIEYDGEKHSAANLFDALKEGYYGKF